MKIDRQLLTLATALLLACAMCLFAGCGSSADEETNGGNIGEDVIEENVDVSDDEIESPVETPDVEMPEIQEPEITEEDLAMALGVDGVTIIELYEEPVEEQRRFAVAVTTEIPEVGADVLDPGKVTYQIYDLAAGVPTVDTEPMQELYAEEYMFSDEAPCHVDDYNFDGAKDFSLWLWAGAQNAQGKFFLWNEKEGMFLEHEALGQLTSPMVKKEFQMILEHIHVSGAEYIDTLYQWSDGELVPVRKIVQWPLDINAFQGEVYDWYEEDWTLMFERKILMSEGEWTQEDYDKLEDLSKELERYYDPGFYGL